MVARTLVIFALFLLAAVIGGAHASETQPESIYMPSLTEVLIAPERHENRLVSVFGYLHQGALYLTEDHARHMDATSLLYVADKASREINAACGERYARVVGRLAKARNTWALTEVEFAEWPERMVNCWERESLSGQ